MSASSDCSGPCTPEEALGHAAQLLREAELSLPDLSRTDALVGIADSWIDLASALDDIVV